MTTRSGHTRVLVVDDSATMRRLIAEALNAAHDLEVVGEAADPIEARAQIKALNPDVVTLDVEMPRMDGIAFLEKIMRLRPTPVVMVSTLTASGADTTLRALEIGAVDCVAKPTDGAVQQIAAELVAKVRIAAQAKLTGGVRAAAAAPAVAPTLRARKAPDDVVIAIGSSTGGVETLGFLFSRLPEDCPPIVIVQHMPPGYTTRMARRLDGASALSVVEAEAGVTLARGQAVVAPGDRHLRLRRAGRAWVTQLDDGPLTSGHKPSVDVLFNSIASSSAASRAVAAVLTGMGDDGASGAAALGREGVAVFAQDEASCVVFGMPKTTLERCPSAQALPLDDIPAALVAAANRIAK